MPIVCIQNMETTRSIRLVVWPGSHLLAREAYLLYARHYWSFFTQWTDLPDNVGKNADDFQPVWNALVDTHVARCFPGIADAPIQPKALTLEPGGLALMSGICQHAGTSDAGRRLFTLFSKELAALVAMIRKNQALLGRSNLSPEPFVFPQGRADPSQTSVVAAGLTLRHLVSTEVFANPAFPEVAVKETIEQCLRWSAWRRDRLQRVNALCWTALNSLPYRLTDNVVPILRKSATCPLPKLGVFGVLCRDGDGNCLVAFVGCSTFKGDHNAAVLRGAAMSIILAKSFRRNDAVSRVPVHVLVWRSMCVETDVVFRSVVQMDGMPLLQYFRQEIEPDLSKMILTEKLRWFSRAIWDAVKDLHARNFRFVTFLFESLAYDERNDRLLLLQSGYGMLFSEDEFKPRANPILSSRQTTEQYAEDGAQIRTLPPSVDRKRVKDIQKQSAAGSDVAEPDLDTILKGKEAADLSNAHLAKFWEDTNRGKRWGQIAFSDMFLFSALNPCRPDSDTALDAHALAESDCHQVALSLYSLVVPFPELDAGLRTKCRNAVQNAVLKNPVELAVKEMKILLNKGKDDAPQTAALDRLANHFVQALRPETRGTFNAEPSNSAFCALHIFSPQHELGLSSTSGVCSKVQIQPVEDEGWWAKARECLRKAGFEAEYVNLLRQTPREACLRNVPGKGIGVWFSGKWGKGEFAGWYVGIYRTKGRGRYSVALHDGKEGHSDGEACRQLLLEWVVKHGLFGAFLNGSQSPHNCNLELLRALSFVYRHPVHNDVELVWTPLKIRKEFSDEEGIWQYNPKADAGRYRQVD
jgi:hypothetical protein